MKHASIGVRHSSRDLIDPVVVKLATVQGIRDDQLIGAALQRRVFQGVPSTAMAT